MRWWRVLFVQGPRDDPPPRRSAMLSYSRWHLADHVLHNSLAAAIKNDRSTTVEMLALIAEADRRYSYRAHGYDSLAGYLVDNLGMSEDMVYKRIGAARAARDYPAIFPAVAEGRLHLTAILMLRPRLTRDNATELLAAAFGRSREQVELLIAERFPKADVPTTLMPIAASPLEPQSDASTFDMTPESSTQSVENTQSSLAPERVAPESSVPTSVAVVPPTPQRRVAPLSVGRYELRLTISQELHDKLRHAQELLSHSVPSGDIPQLLERAIDELIAKQEKRQLAVTERPRGSRRSSHRPRHIAAEVKREVRKRDGGRCTFVSQDGHRC